MHSDSIRGGFLTAEKSMIQQVPLACIADTVVTLPEAAEVPPGGLHSQHVEQPGQSWDQWPTNSLWGAIAGRPLHTAL